MPNEPAFVSPQLNRNENRSKYVHKLYSYSNWHVTACPSLPVTGYGGLKLESINPCSIHGVSST